MNDEEPGWLRWALTTMLGLREDAMDEAIVAAVDDLRRDPTGAIVGGGHDALRASLRAVLGAGDIADAELIALVGDLRRVESSRERDGADLRHLRTALWEVLGVSAGMFDDDIVAWIRRYIRDPATRAADEALVDDRAMLNEQLQKSRSELTRLRAALRDAQGVDIRDRATLCADEEGDHDRAIAMLSVHGLPPGLTLAEMVACLLDRIDR